MKSFFNYRAGLTEFAAIRVRIAANLIFSLVTSLNRRGSMSKQRLLIMFVLGVFVLSVLIAGTSPTPQATAQEDPVRLIASFSILAAIAANVAGDAAEVGSLIPVVSNGTRRRISRRSSTTRRFNPRSPCGERHVMRTKFWTQPEGSIVEVVKGRHDEQITPYIQRRIQISHCDGGHSG